MVEKRRNGEDVSHSLLKPKLSKNLRTLKQTIWETVRTLSSPPLPTYFCSWSLRKVKRLVKVTNLVHGKSNLTCFLRVCVPVCVCMCVCVEWGMVFSGWWINKGEAGGMEEVQAMQHNFQIKKIFKIQIFNFLNASSLLTLSSLLFQLNFIPERVTE